MFKNQQLTYYTGNYDEYRQQVEERQLHQQRLADGIERKRDHMEKRWAGGQEEGKRRQEEAGTCRCSRKAHRGRGPRRMWD